MTIIDGKEVAAKLRKEIAAEVEAWVALRITAHLIWSPSWSATDGASQTYVGHKEKCCAEVGFRSTVLRLDEAISEAYLLGEIAKLNNDPDVDGFIVQLPLPKHISEQKVIEAIDPRKDVDGFHPVNTGRMISGLPSYLPATRTASSSCSNTTISKPQARTASLSAAAT
ncbi:MAG: tetrahydrofolate dehydrogenase/cyclohydrolase catalytic domain-containing protein [Alistipes indistinctus]